ncbi:hypothetical protein [Rahnella inusitata]|uniref:hypothetical protein n=1 Tax=Rahnella inusitata TaxID=58169 RepID=UPI001FD4A302|nr:hypothetical protein [Rahnella inusitata]
MKLSIEQLKAIRELRIESEESMVVRALDELIAIRELRGDQVPVVNPVLPYADSYRDMARRGADSVPIWGVITDLERNIAPLFTVPQKSVVLDLNYFDEHFDRLLDEKDDDIEIGQLGARNYEALHIAIHQSIKAAIEAAGGIVKDGE